MLHRTNVVLLVFVLCAVCHASLVKGAKVSVGFTEERSHDSFGIEECECINGECIPDAKGKLQCFCPPTFGHYTEHHCKACNCGAQFNCTYEGILFVDKHCICPEPYKDKDGVCKGPCDAAPCKNNGTCSVDGNSFKCKCVEPYSGNTCTEKCECINGKCALDESGKNACVCPPAFGHFTEHHCKACECGDGFNCTYDGILIKEKHCLCPPPLKVNDGMCKGPCDVSPCRNNGTCIVEGNSFNCKCAHPYSGKTCTEKCECINGECIEDENGKFQCACPSEYAHFTEHQCKACDCGTGFQCTFEGFIFERKHCICPKPLKDEGGVCKGPCDRSPCQNNGTCFVTGESFNCICAYPYTEETCTEKCECINGDCIRNENGKFECICPSTFGHFTEHHCKACECGTGLNCTYDGILFKHKHCICPEPLKDKDGICKGPCDGSPCQNNGSCIVTGNSFICECPEPFSGKACSEKCECINGKCIMDTNEKYQCACPPGFGHFTEHHCKSCDCGTGFNCTFEGFIFEKKRCICPEPYTEKDGVCKGLGPCDPTPCENKGRCISNGNSFKCECVQPYSGTTCSEEPCHKSPCKNNGTCSVEGSIFKCKCVSAYTGETCTEMDTQGPTKNLALKIVMPILSVILIASFVFNYYRWRKHRTDVQTESDTQPICSTE